MIGNASTAFLLKPNTSRIVLLLSLGVSFFWIFATIVNVYNYAVVGAIFELLWLFAILLIFALPVVAVLGWITEKFRLRSGYLFSILIVLLTILFLQLSVK